MAKRWQRWAICASIAAASAIGARLLSDLRFFELLNLKSLDAHFLLRGELPPPQNFRLILADQHSLDTFSELRMFWHPYYADAIRAAGAGGAKVIGLDIAFCVPVEQWEKDDDHKIADAVISSPVPVVAAYVEKCNGNSAAQQVPLNLLSASLGLAAFPNLTADQADDFVRRQELIEAPPSHPSDPPPAHSFALRIAEKYLGTDAEFKNGRLTLGGSEIPIGSPASADPRAILIRDASPHGTVPAVSLADVVQALREGRTADLKEWFNGRIVMIGSGTVDDVYATPFTALGGRSWMTPGVEIHADTVRTILDRTYLLDAPWWARAFALLAAAGTAAALGGTLAAWPAATWIAAELLAIFGLTDMLFRFGRVISTSETMLAALGAGALTTTYRLLSAERRGQLFHRAVSLFVGKQVAMSLDEVADIRLSGKSMNLTILFTDIRGFTAYTERVCEERGPEVVVDELNKYMAQMVAIIIKYHGHVNKFIGDGILGIFCDEDEKAAPGDHALRAVRCALEIVTCPNQFQTGSGIHTGLAVVGNIGSADKMEYTVLGDTVNLASRLESLNKEFHTRMLMSEATYQHLNGAIEAVCLGAAPVRGKAVPIRLYTPVAIAPSPDTPASSPQTPASKALTNA